MKGNIYKHVSIAICIHSISASDRLLTMHVFHMSNIRATHMSIYKQAKPEEM